MKQGKEKIVQIAICDGNLKSCLEWGAQFRVGCNDFCGGNFESCVG